MSIFPNKHILLGVTGSIAAFKVAELASRLTQMGAQVDVILTPSAQKFVTPLTFQSVTGRKVFTDADLWGGEAHILHVGLAQAADILVIAPCTAGTLAKLAHGQADNLLTITALAARCPILVAPAMDAGMFTHPATQDNVRILTGRGVHFAGPDEGRMASGLNGKGRLVEPGELAGYIRLVLGHKGKLAGRKVVVTAGGTQEPIDPVRVITNRSTGKQGFALAQAAVDVGASVVLVSTPTASALSVPVGVQLVEVRTAQEMLEAVLAEAASADALVMAAAVADFRPTSVSKNKLKKRDGVPQVDLEAAPDILAAVAELRARTHRPGLVAGFAAESHDLVENAEAKLLAKNLDMIVANDISVPGTGFGSDNNRVILLHADGRREELPLMSKSEVAETIIKRISVMLETQ